MQPRGGNICMKRTKALVFVEKGKIVCEKWQNNECVGGRAGGWLQQGMFMSIFHSYLCILVNHLYGFLEPRFIICTGQHN